MSLIKCLKKIAINDSDRKAINAIAEDLKTDGMTEEEISIAENLAVEEYLSSIDKDLDSVASRAEKLGGKARKVEETADALKQEDRATFTPMSSAAKMVNLTDAEMKETSDLEAINPAQREAILNRFIEEINAEAKKIVAEEKVVSVKKYTEALNKKESELDEEIKTLDKDLDRMSKEVKGLTKKNDTIGRFISKNGGLNREEMTSQGIDPEHFKSRMKVVGKPLFPKKGGMSVDAVRELLNEQNHSDKDISANEALDIISNMLVDDNVFVDQEVGAKVESINDSISKTEEKIADKKEEKNNNNIKSKAEKIADYEVSEDNANILDKELVEAEAEKRLEEIIKERAESKSTKKWVNPTLESSIIRLSNSSDASSFLHESAHLFLDMEARFATGELTADQQTILDFLGMKSFSELIIDGEITAKQKEAHEKWAETFEVYLREGKAPSSELREAFAAFKSWLVQIYKTLSDPRLSRAALNPEIKEVFDRLLASEIEIEQMKANPAYDQMFKNKEQAGMTDAQFEAYQKQAKKAHNRSQQNLDDTLIKELMSRKTKEWEKEKKVLIAEETAKLNDKPIYQLIGALKKMPMDIALVREALGMKPPKKGEKKSDIEKLIGKYSKKTGADPHDYQNEYGFNSIEHMFQSLIDSNPIKQVAKENAEQIMIDKYGDILNDGSIELEVREAIHNDEQAKLALMELRALNRKGPRIDRQRLKDNAKELISEMKFSEIQPSKYYQAEIKSAKMSVSDKENATQHKIQQLANHYLYKEAVKAKEEMVKIRRYVRKLQDKTYSTRVVEQTYAKYIQMLAKSYNMKQGEAGKKDNTLEIVNWMIPQLNDEFIQFDILDPALLQMIHDHVEKIPNDYELPAFDDMTLGELQGLSDQLKHFRHIGGKLADENKAQLVNERAADSDSIIDNGGKKKPTKMVETKWFKLVEMNKKFIYSHRRIGGIFQTLDGFLTGGRMARYYTEINDASNKELELTADMSESMKEAFDGVMDFIGGIAGRRKTTIIKADGKPFELDNRSRFVLGLNWGNEGNKFAVVEGMNAKLSEEHGEFTEADIMKMLSGMSETEIRGLDKVWKAKEPLWPELSAVEMRLKGVSPPKVELTPLVINGIQLDGGHYRLHYRKDPNDSIRTELSTDGTLSDKIKLTTASSANPRVGSGGRLVDLNLENLFHDLTENIHYIAFAELGDSLNATFKGVNNPVVSSIIQHYGQAYYDNMMDTLGGITKPREPVAGFVWKAMKRVRTNLTYGYLALSVRNVVQQPIAITNAYSQIGFARTTKGMIDFYKSPIENVKMIQAMSAFMNNRTKLVNREAAEQMGKIDSIHPKLGAMKNMAFLPQTFADSLVAYPVWMGAKSKFQQENPLSTEKEANAYADEMVAKTIGSGLAKDLGSILTQGEAMKQITFMGTFFNLTWNLHVENAQLLKRGKISGMEYARRVGWMAIAPALMTMFLMRDIPEDDDDIAWHAMKEVGAYNMSSIFLVRDIAGAMKSGFDPNIVGMKGPKSSATALVEVLPGLKALITGDEDLDAELVGKVLRVAQPLINMPGSSQAIRWIQGMGDESQNWYEASVEGKNRN